MKKTIISGILATTLMATASLPAFAASGHDGNRGNRDGRHGSSIERLMEKFDINRDGSITPDEMLQHRASIFASADVDNNGELTPDEFKQLREIRKDQQKQAHEKMNRDGGNNHGSKHERKGHGRHGPDFSLLDTDDSGTLDIDEFTTSSDRMFKHLDRNGDGAINKGDIGQKRADAGKISKPPVSPAMDAN